MVAPSSPWKVMVPSQNVIKLVSELYYKNSAKSHHHGKALLKFELLKFAYCLHRQALHIFYFRDVLFIRGNAGGAGAGEEPAKAWEGFQMDGLPGRRSARGQRRGGSPQLWTSQRLSPIFAGWQLLIRKGGLQRRPFSIPQQGCLLPCPLSRLPAISWSAVGLPLFVSNGKCRDRMKHVAGKQESGCFLMGLVKPMGFLGAPRNSSPVPLVYKGGSWGPERGKE